MKIELSPRMLTAMNYLVNHLGDQQASHKNLPVYNADGEPIASLKDLADAMGVDTKVAALYALQNKRDELQEEALGQFSRFGHMQNLSIDGYIAKITRIKPETKRVRLVRTVMGARRFSQPRGSIIVTDGEAPLDNLVAMPNDVRGYDKVTDSKGRIFYIGEEANRWVVRAPGQHEPLFIGDSDRDAYYWLNNAVVGKKPPKKAKS